MTDDNTSALSPELVKLMAKAMWESDGSLDWDEAGEENRWAVQDHIDMARAALSAALPILREEELCRMLERLEFRTEHGKHIKGWIKHYAKTEHGLDLNGKEPADD